ncbi:hypothetical protein J6590_023332 [Homalodisca vitripennis]|nr:hypothetical protein J6590_023332 [Homalodisca vitripennis]
MSKSGLLRGRVLDVESFHRPRTTKSEDLPENLRAPIGARGPGPARVREVLEAEHSQRLGTAKVGRYQRSGHAGGNLGTTALFNLVFREQNVLQALDESRRMLGIFCDLSKAIDCVNHNLY